MQALICDWKSELISDALQVKVCISLTGATDMSMKFSNVWRLLAVFAFSFWLSGAHAFSPQSGLWIVNSENDGKPGRGLSIDVQNNVMVVAMYTYEASGEPVFYLGSAPLQYDSSAIPSVTMELIRYKGGRYFGGPATAAEVQYSAGTVRFRFTSGGVGFVTFPKEPEKAIVRFNYGYDNSPGSLKGQWLFVSLASFGQEVEVVNLEQLLPPTATGNGVVATLAGDFTCEYQTSGTYRYWTVCHKYDRTGAVARTYQMSYLINDGEGLMGSGSAARTEPLVVKRLRDANRVSLGNITK